MDPVAADSKLNSAIKVVASSPILHAVLPLIAVVLVATERKYPTLKQDIAGALLLCTSFSKVIESLLGALTGNSKTDDQE